MDAQAWRIVILVGLIGVGLLCFRPGRGGGRWVCSRCGFAAAPATPACPRCGRDLHNTAIELERLEQARRRGEIDEGTYRRRKLELIRRDDGG